MSKRKVCYELYIDDKLAARGDIDLMASLIGNKPETVRHMPYRRNTPSWFKLIALPVLYDFNGESMTSDELAAKYYVGKQSIISAASSTHRLLGKVVRKHDYGTFSVSQDDFDRMVVEARNADGNRLQED